MRTRRLRSARASSWDSIARSIAASNSSNMQRTARRNLPAKRWRSGAADAATAHSHATSSRSTRPTGHRSFADRNCRSSRVFSPSASRTWFVTHGRVQRWRAPRLRQTPENKQGALRRPSAPCSAPRGGDVSPDLPMPQASFFASARACDSDPGRDLFRHSDAPLNGTRTPLLSSQSMPARRRLDRVGSCASGRHEISNASTTGLNVIGTLGILLGAKRAGLLPAIRRELDGLVRTSFFLSPQLYTELHRPPARRTRRPSLRQCQLEGTRRAGQDRGAPKRSEGKS